MKREISPSAGPRDESLVELVRAARPHLVSRGSETEAWLTRLETQHDSLHELVERLLDTDPQAALELAATLWRFWWQRGHMKEGREMMERVVAVDGPNR